MPFFSVGLEMCGKKLRRSSVYRAKRPDGDGGHVSGARSGDVFKGLRASGIASVWPTAAVNQLQSSLLHRTAVLAQRGNGPSRGIGIIGRTMASKGPSALRGAPGRANPKTAQSFGAG